jgi:3D (Asp-Asp-Asp) domain-containing protein
LKVFLFIIVLAFFGCKNSEETFEDKYIWDSKTVTATAYNSLAYQTNSNPNITAFGDSLKPGLKYIAVSRDLLRAGLKNNIPVKIDGLEGIYLVKDKMHSRWRNRIDIYMGVDVTAAKQWGKKKVCIEFGLPKEK